MNFDRFVGLPYKDGGRDWEGCDCWGLVRMAFREQTGIVLPSYSDKYHTAEDDAANAALISGLCDDWIEIHQDLARHLDFLLMKTGGLECHIGLIVRSGLVLHTGMWMRISCIESYNSLRIRKRISRFMRYKALA